MWPILLRARLSFARCHHQRGVPIKLASLLVCCLLSTLGHAQPLAAGAYLAQLQRGVDSGLYDQLAVGWIDGTLSGPGQRQSWYLGRTHKPDANSAFEIGAASEVFTGLLLAHAAINGKVRMDTTLRELLPEDFSFADARLGALRLQQLATRRSGLPAMPPNLFPHDPADPYAGFDEQALLAFLANFHIAPQADAQAYSILDAGLLGDALGRAYGQRYAVALVSQILDPLGMTHTGIGDDSHLLQGSGNGQPAAHWHYGALAGAAGLRSTLPDLLQFLQACLTPEHSPLRAALLLSRQSQDDASRSVGLGWNTLDVATDAQRWPLVWRASRTAGFSAFLGFRTDQQQALVLLGNTDADLSGLGLAWLEGRSPPPLTAPPPAQPEPGKLTDYIGLYQNSGDGVVIVRAEAGVLSVQFPGTFPLALMATGADVFASSAAGVVLSFQRERHTVGSLLLGRNGANILAQRIAPRAPRLRRTAVVVADGQLQRFAGEYRLNDLAMLRIGVLQGRLVLQATGQAPIFLRSFAADRFSDEAGACELHFQRDDKGSLVAVTLLLAGIERRATKVQWRIPETR